MFHYPHPNRAWCKFLLLVLGAVILAPADAAPPSQIRMCLPYLMCSEARESRREVYFIVAWQYLGSDTGGAQRLIGPDGGNWAISEADSLRDVLLWEGELAGKDSVQVVVSLFECSGGSLGDYNELADRMAKLQTSRPRQPWKKGEIERQIRQAGLIGRTADNYLGSFMVVTRKVKPSTRWSPLDRCTILQTSPKSKELVFTHEGSRYRASIVVECASAK